MSKHTYESAKRFLKFVFLVVLESALIYGLVCFFLSLK
jgi:F0F1-type ATP synthase membrane subunit c/vacuolar-type H+-ATPase subunit K